MSISLEMKWHFHFFSQFHSEREKKLELLRTFQYLFCNLVAERKSSDQNSFCCKKLKKNNKNMTKIIDHVAM